jgi:tRNA nucleotidyltransferase (CCA-adding enzyme)
LKRLIIPAGAARLLQPLAKAAAAKDLPLYAVGGCVRDWLLGLSCKDLDLVTEGDPHLIAPAVARLLGGKPEAFGAFGTLRVAGGGFRIDLATSRKERYSQPAALPEVSPAPLEKDLLRRDFTVNTMALRLSAGKSWGELIDPCGGLKDLRAKKIRVLHPRSFEDDPTRVFRAARYLCRYRLKPVAGLAAAARRSLGQGHAGRLSRHRLTQELIRILEEKDPAKPLAVLKHWGYLGLIHPRLKTPRKFPRGWRRGLAAMALAMGKDGAEFIRSLPIGHEDSLEILTAVKTAAGRASPRGVLPKLSREALREAFPSLAPAALKPLFISGADLAEAGVQQGKAYGLLLDKAARAQWAGRIKTRKQALLWLSRH